MSIQKEFKCVLGFAMYIVDFNKIYCVRIDFDFKGK